MEFDIVSVRPPPADSAALILVVEDELLVRMIVSDCLRDAGFEVIEAGNADEAMLALHSNPAIELVLSDVRMPGSMDGLQLLRHARAQFPGLPFIITSGHLLAHDALASGASHFLGKPYSFERAIELVEGELARAR